MADYDPALVSVIMPVRDGGQYLHLAVESILKQSHTGLELILVNDRSSDNAIAALGLHDPRLRIVDSAGPGVAAAFNTGLAKSSGGFIARMDADDIALDRRLSVQLALFTARPDIEIAGGCVEIFAAEGIAEGNRSYQEWLNALLEPEDIHREMFIESPIPNPTAMFRRAALERLGAYHDPDWPEDYDLYLRADRLGMKMAKPAGVVLRWRDHAGRLTRTDRRYDMSLFQRAKAHYLARGRIAREGVLLWGAGPGGRLMHDLLEAEGVRIEGFVDVHPRRIGGTKRGLPVWPVERAATWDAGMVLVAVGARGARQQIRTFMQGHGRIEGRDFLLVA